MTTTAPSRSQPVNSLCIASWCATPRTGSVITNAGQLPSQPGNAALGCITAAVATTGFGVVTGSGSLLTDTAGLALLEPELTGGDTSSHAGGLDDAAGTFALRAAANAAAAGPGDLAAAAATGGAATFVTVLAIGAATLAGMLLAAARGVDSGAPVPADQSGVKASMRKSVMVKPAYSSGARPSS